MNSDYTEEKERPGKRDLVIFYALESVIVGIFLLTGPAVASHMLLIFVQIAGLWLIVWVVWTNKVRKFRISLDLPSRTRFVAKGPYNFVRYPVYTAMLIITLAIAIDRLDIEGFALWLILLAVFIMNIRFEDRLYSSYFSDYSLYKGKTSRLIPFVY
jgi:protein-S-isoprenylcysteine O-methyltransferase Ste14